LGRRKGKGLIIQEETGFLHRGLEAEKFKEIVVLEKSWGGEYR